MLLLSCLFVLNTVTKDPWVILVTYITEVNNSQPIVVHTNTSLAFNPLASKDGNLKIDTVL
jgi:hypothetical protein